jgi:hypothetical protein
MIRPYRASLLRSWDSPKGILLMDYALIRFVMRGAGHSIVKIL